MTINLVDGHAESMGDGNFLLMQADDTGAVQSVYLTASDLAALGAGNADTPSGASAA